MTFYWAKRMTLHLLAAAWRIYETLSGLLTVYSCVSKMNIPQFTDDFRVLCWSYYGGRHGGENNVWCVMFDVVVRLFCTYTQDSWTHSPQSTKGILIGSPKEWPELPRTSWSCILKLLSTSYPFLSNFHQIRIFVDIAIVRKLFFQNWKPPAWWRGLRVECMQSMRLACNGFISWIK